MSNISVAEVLKIHGKWIEGKPFAELVAKKKKICERHAYNLIKKASKNREILRTPLSNRSVLYGLPEFGPQKNEDKTSIESDNNQDVVYEPRIIDIEMLKLYQDLQAFKELSPEFNNDERIKMIDKVLRKLAGVD